VDVGRLFVARNVQGVSSFENGRKDSEVVVFFVLFFKSPFPINHNQDALSFDT